MKEKGSAVDHPSHYNAGDVECIDALKALASREEYKGFLRLNAVKYLWRMGHKGDALEDLEKARWYLDRLISELEEEEKNVSERR